MASGGALHQHSLGTEQLKSTHVCNVVVPLPSSTSCANLWLPGCQGCLASPTRPVPEKRTTVQNGGGAFAHKSLAKRFILAADLLPLFHVSRASSIPTVLAWARLRLHLQQQNANNLKHAQAARYTPPSLHAPYLACLHHEGAPSGSHGGW